MPFARATGSTPTATACFCCEDARLRRFFSTFPLGFTFRAPLLRLVPGMGGAYSGMVREICEANRGWESAFGALPARNPQEFPGNLIPLWLYPARNRSICEDNTTSCALYLTHPTEGGTFTIA